MSVTRRRLLEAVLPVGTGVSLAGCSDPDLRPDVMPGTEDDPDVYELRNPEGESVIETIDETESSFDSISFKGELFSDESTAEAIAFADDVPSEEAASARSFLTDTDFDSASVFVVERETESCYRHLIQSVSWEEGQIEYHDCSKLRPADEPCEVDERVPVALFVRIPESIGMDVDLSNVEGAHQQDCSATDSDWVQIGGNATATNETIDGTQEAIRGDDER